MDKHNIDVKDVLQSLCELKCVAHLNKNKQVGYENNLFPFQKDVVQGIENNLNNINDYLDLFIQEAKYSSKHDFQHILNETLTENVEKIIPQFFNSKELQSLKASSEYKRFQALAERIAQEKEILNSTETLSFSKDSEDNTHTSGLQNLVDIKKDENYELLYIKDNLEGDFFSNHLVSILKKQEKKLLKASLDDPFIQISVWNDIQKQKFANNLLQSSHESIVNFYKISLKNLDKQVVNVTHKSLMALLLAKNTRNLLGSLSTKSCTKYLQDFMFFFRQALIEKSCCKENGDPVLNVTFNLLDNLSEKLFVQQCFYDDIHVFLEDKISSFKNSENADHIKKISYLFLDIYEKLDTFIKKFPNGPLFKAIDVVISEEKLLFDPFQLGFLPNNEGMLYIRNNQPIKVSRLATPIIQASLQNLKISEEFMNFLEVSSLKLNEKILFIQLENRNNIKSKSRTKLFEELSERAEFFNNFYTVTIPDSRDFLNYFENKHSTSNIDEFTQILYLEITGSDSFYFISQFMEKDVCNSVLEIFEKIKVVFFDTKKSFFKSDKLFFLDIFSSILILKSIETSNPSLLLFSSKDGLDNALSSWFFLELLIKILSDKEKIQEAFVQRFLIELLAPTLLMRDRLLFSGKIEILGKLLNVASKKTKSLIDKLAPLFCTDIQNWKIKKGR